MDSVAEYPYAPKCPGCGKPGQLADAEEVYGDEQYEGEVVWVCETCDTRAGCYSGTSSPLGTMADLATRRARIDAHEAFGTLWSKRGHEGNMSRAEAQRWLAKELGIETDGRTDLNIGTFSAEQCQKVIGAVERFLGANNDIGGS